MPEVIVIGGANVDIKGRSSAEIVPGTSNPGTVTVASGGVGRNIAHTLALLGVEVSFIGVVGSDAHGQKLRSETAAAGVDLSMLQTGKHPTGTYLAILDYSGELQSAINDMRATESLTPKILDNCGERIAEARFLVADCNLRIDCLEWLVDFARTKKVRLLFEPVSVAKSRKLLELPTLQGIFAITPNAQQLSALTGDNDPIAAVANLHRLGFQNVIVHRGSQGATVSDGSAPPQPVSAYPVDQVSDVTGAGDAAVAGLVYGLLGGHTLINSARLGQAAAAMKLRSRSSIAAGISRDSILALAGLG